MATQDCNNIISRNIKLLPNVDGIGEPRKVSYTTFKEIESARTDCPNWDDLEPWYQRKSTCNFMKVTIYTNEKGEKQFMDLNELVLQAVNPEVFCVPIEASNVRIFGEDNINKVMGNLDELDTECEMKIIIYKSSDDLLMWEMMQCLSITKTDRQAPILMPQTLKLPNGEVEFKLSLPQWITYCYKHEGIQAVIGYSPYDGCLMVKYHDMTMGIEHDGYAHT